MVKRIWPIARRLLSAAFLLLVAALLVHLARQVEWREVGQTLAAMPLHRLALAAAAALGSYAVYTSFDVLARVYTGHHLPASQVVPLAFVSYAFNLNLSAWVGSIGMRYRLYRRLGLGTGVVTRIFTFSLMTNWLGYLLLAGLVFAGGAIRAPESWPIGGVMLRGLGAVLLLVVAAYLVLCARGRRKFHVRGHEVALPSLRLAACQLALGAANWSLMALAIYILLARQLPYPMVLGALLVSAIAGVVAHIPAGLGVLEAVFVAVAGAELGKSTVLAALLGYRAVYFLLPLAIATLVYLVLEAHARRLRARNQTPPGDDLAYQGR